MTEINEHNGVDVGHPRGHWMMVSDGITYSRFYPLDPQPNEINIGIIAHHLSNLCRFTGATARHYSIAEHSVLVADEMWEQTDDPYAALIGLLHDAPEAITNDMNRPLKTTDEMKPFRDVDANIWNYSVAPHFGLPEDFGEYASLLKEVDIRMCSTEKRDLLPGSEEWVNMPEPYDHLSLVNEVSPATAKRTFLATYYQIMEELS